MIFDMKPPVTRHAVHVPHIEITFLHLVISLDFSNNSANIVLKMLNCLWAAIDFLIKYSQGLKSHEQSIHWSISGAH